MRTINRNGIFVLLICMFGVVVATAQSPALDPVRVAPHIFETVLENDRVRVLKVTERNGETAPLHSHPARLVVHLSPCAWMEESADGSRQMQSYRLGDVRWLARTTHGGETSTVVQECSMLDVELK